MSPTRRATQPSHPGGPGTADDETPHPPRDCSDRHDRYEMIAEAAWFKAEQRGFVAGDDLLDWLEAEEELLRRFERNEPEAVPSDATP